MHDESNRGVIRFLNRYNPNELKSVSRFLEDTLEASWVRGELNKIEDKNFE
ncbi:MarR family transcriptional regulator [Bacillus pseudomycoides]|uniref:MarR family transcriptional regulator n=1 Tax=Bacillus pseudomycoides TaxID=64104 RepID=A0AAJ3V7X5_9BACI|nr:MarR family transcriptional regulator [Bacillus pseudomycoides]MDR4189496.1 MarR family transcriptional regulator [Bacillus pseudomycoides]MDR4328601.1 MarR family transcriptional regulator [Bacillus pseudomycoides]PEK30897.1 MarR family transcriptional regulator [Bacillus pseudomycoides]PEK66565.1 MarR family transcriptional regulator [Bacillus pseudomycoides]PEO42708.1 MarR family transcriptional regulator [Bacillus pseudomycoides]